MTGSSFKTYRKIITLLALIFITAFAHAQDSKKWIIAAQKFSFTGKEKQSVAEGISKMIPERILENISKSSFRTLYVSEAYERELYKLKNERTSLFLQLSAEIQKRDSLVLHNYSKEELNAKIAKEEEAILEIKKKIDENLSKQKEYEEKILAAGKNEIYKNTHDENQIEKIEIFQNNYSALYEVPSTIKFTSYDNRLLEKDIVQNNINALITGNIKAYGEYIAVSVELYNYPGGNCIARATEYGSLDEADIIASSIVRQIAPSVTNSLPIEIKFNSNVPQDDLLIYIDDVLQKNVFEKLKLDSGVHHFEFVCKEYTTVLLDYYFEGNQTYVIEINMRKKEYLDLSLFPKTDLNGTFYVDGKEFEGQIEINGKPVLGQFYAGKKSSDFFILDNQKLEEGNTYLVDVDLTDKNDYIEKRRRWMYTSYSVLICSLIPTFYLNGQAQSYAFAGQAGYLQTQQQIDEANRWILASDISTGISVACGVWFVYELVRYLYAANSILPKEAELAPMDFSREKEVPEDKEAAEAEKAEDEASQKTEIIDESVKADDKTDNKKTE